MPDSTATATDSGPYAWSSSSAYLQGAVVVHNGAWYVANTGASGDSSGNEPSEASSIWKLLTRSGVGWVVTSADQMKTALESGTKTIVIYAYGDFTDVHATIHDVNATLQPATTTVVIYSDDALRTGSITITRASGSASNCAIYWYSKGSIINGLVTLAAQGSAATPVMYLDRAIAG